MTNEGLKSPEKIRSILIQLLGEKIHPMLQNSPVFIILKLHQIFIIKTVDVTAVRPGHYFMPACRKQ